MASAEEYAQWIVANKDKKGTPEFETVAKAYELARGQPKEQPAAPKKPTILEGAMQRVKNTLSLTPPGVALNVAGGLVQAHDKLAYEAGGKVTDVTGSPELGGVTNMAIQAIPSLLGMGAGKAAAPVLERGAEKLMHSALKPQGKDIVSGDAAKAIDTLLRADATVSPKGAAKIRGLISKLEGEVKVLVAGASKTSTEAGLPAATVDKAYVASEVMKELKKFRNQVNPGADTKEILKSWDEFNKLVGSKIPVEQAQSLKQGTYKLLSDKYAKQGTVENVPGTQAQMSMARGLRKGVEDAVPGVGNLTAQESSLINALEMAERRAGIGGNRDIGGIAWLANNPPAAAAMMADRSSAFKSWLANRLFQYRQTVPQAVGGTGTAVADSISQ